MFCPPPPGRRTAFGALLAALVVTVAACGSSSTTSSSSSAAAGASSSAAAGSSSSPAASSAYPPGCHPAAAPAPRAPIRLPGPQLRLDPGRTYTVRMLTNCGEIDVRLDVRRAPRTTASFASLVRRGFYDGLGFGRVAADFVIQGGDPAGDGSGGPGYQVVEPPPAGLQYRLGTVAMAKTASDPSGASGSQFFIITGAQGSSLPPQYALVGQVVRGQAVAGAIGRIATTPAGDGAPVAPVVMIRVTLSGG